MIYHKLLILTLVIQLSIQQWVPVYREGYDQSLSLNSKDIGKLSYCDAYGYPIIISDYKLEKTIYLNNLKPFAHTKLLIDFIHPKNTKFEVTIQDKIQPSFSLNQDFVRQQKNDCFEDYEENTLHYEIYGNKLQKIKIQIEKKNQFQDFDVTQESSKQFFAIKQIHILQIQCQENCKRCVYDSLMKLQCSTCDSGYELSANDCVCNQYFQNNQCVEKCDIGYYSDIFRICQKGDFLNKKELISVSQEITIQNSLEITSQLENSINYYLELEFEFEKINFQHLMSFEIYYGEGLFSYFMHIFNDTIHKQVDQIEQLSSNENSSRFKTILPITESYNQKVLIAGRINDSSTLNEFRRKKGINNINNSSIILNKLTLNEVKINNLNCFTKNCQTCSRLGYQETCNQCKDSFQIFNGTCIKNCPMNTKNIQNTCILEQQIMPYGYIIDNIFKLESENAQNGLFHFKTNASELLFGIQGYDYSFQKDLFSPHYALTIQSTITFIDFDDQSMFQFSFDEQQLNIYPNEMKQQIEGDSRLPDSKVDIIEYIMHQNSSILINASCKGAIVCYISNLKIYVHECHPYCQQCTGPKLSECLEFSPQAYEFNKVLKQCIPGYFQNKNNICEMCSSSCQVCQDNQYCQLCKNDHKLINGRCLFK